MSESIVQIMGVPMEETAPEPIPNETQPEADTYDAMYIQLHACFMIFAWVCASSIGIFLAKHYKQSESKLGNKSQWFLWHRILMSLTWVCTIVGVVLIFVYIDGWSTSVHSILGIITTAFCFIHPLMALIRPSRLQVGKRLFFSWKHMIGGIGAHIGGLVTIHKAMDLPQLAKRSNALDIVYVAFLSVHIVCHCIVAKINSEEFKEKASWIFFCVYAVIVLLFTIALMVFIGVMDYVPRVDESDPVVE